MARSTAGLGSLHVPERRRRLVSLASSFLFLLTLLAIMAPGAAAVDPFPVLLGRGDTFEIPADALPGWLFTNAGTHQASELYLEDATGEVFARAPADRSHQVTMVEPPAAEGPLTVRANGETWTAWVREWRFGHELNTTLYVDCPVDEHVAFLWSPPASRGVVSIDGNESGLALFVYADEPFKLLFHGEGDVSFGSGVVQAGERAFWVVARATGAPCGEGFELTFTEDRVIDLNVFDSLGWLIAAGVFVMLVLLWFSRPGRGNQLGPGKGAKAVLPFGLVLGIVLMAGGLLMAAPVAEANGDPHAGFATGPLVAGGFQGVTVPETGGRLCFQAEDAASAGRVQVIEDARGQDDLRTLRVPSAPARVCTDVAGGPVEFAGEVQGRYLLMPEAPRLMRTPGTAIADGAGGVFILQDATPTTRIGALVQSGWSVHVLDLATFGLVAETDQAGEVPGLVEGLDLPRGERTDLLVVAENGRDDGAGDVRIQWQDPSWFALVPTFGQVLLVVAIALFVILYREGRRHHPLYGPPRR